MPSNFTHEHKTTGIVILAEQAVHYQPMMELRWFRTKFGRHNNCILQQAWRGSDGSVDWRPINVVDADG